MISVKPAMSFYPSNKQCLHCAFAIVLCLLTMMAQSLDANAAEDEISFDQLFNLENPYTNKITNTVDQPGPVPGSKEYIHYNALSERFERCKRSLSQFISFTNLNAIVRKGGGKNTTKLDLMTINARRLNLKYPYDNEQIDAIAGRSVDKLSLEMSWKLQGAEKGHIEKVTPIYFEACLNLPLEKFEAEWASASKKVEKAGYDEDGYDAEGYDEDGYDESGRTREENAALFSDYD